MKQPHSPLNTEIHLLHNSNWSAKFSSNTMSTLISSQGARHTFAQMAGRNVANPVAMLLCSCDMLKHLQWVDQLLLCTTQGRIQIFEWFMRLRGFEGEASMKFLGNHALQTLGKHGQCLFASLFWLEDLDVYFRYLCTHIYLHVRVIQVSAFRRVVSILCRPIALHFSFGRGWARQPNGEQQ